MDTNQMMIQMMHKKGLWITAFDSRLLVIRMDSFLHLYSPLSSISYSESEWYFSILIL